MKNKPFALLEESLPSNILNQYFKGKTSYSCFYYLNKLVLFDIKPNSLLLQSTYCHRDCVTLGDKVVILLSNCEIKSKTIYCLCLLAIILSIYLYCNVRTIQKGGTSWN